MWANLVRSCTDPRLFDHVRVELDRSCMGFDHVRVEIVRSCMGRDCSFMYGSRLFVHVWGSIMYGSCEDRADWSCEDRDDWSCEDVICRSTIDVLFRTKENIKRPLERSTTSAGILDHQDPSTTE